MTKSEKNMKIGLSTKFVILVVAILSTTLFTTTLYVHQSQKINFYDQLNEKINLLGSFISKISPEVMLAYDYTILDTYMMEVTKRSDIVIGVVYDTRGNSLTSYLNENKPEVSTTIENLQKKEIKEILFEIKKNTSIIFRDFPIVDKGKTIGYVTLGISTKRLTALAKQSVLELAAIYSAIILFLSITLYFVFRLSTLEPIADIINGSHRISKGNFDTPVEIHAHDELGELSHSINKMMEQLKQNSLEKDDVLNKLTHLNHTLEDSVRFRTKALQENKTLISTIYDNIGEGIIVFDEYGIIESVNNSTIRMFDSSVDQLIGAHITLLIITNRIEDVFVTDQKKDKIYNTTETQNRRHYMETKGASMDGKIFPIEVVITSMILGKKTLRICMVHDISKRKAVENSLAESQQQLIESAHQAGMAEIATGILHNIGNVLNSVGVSVQVINRIAKSDNILGLLKANKMFIENQENIKTFLEKDEKGKKLPNYYLKLGEVLHKDMTNIIDEVNTLSEKVTMIKEVICTQQNNAKFRSFEETLDITSIVEDALAILKASLYNGGVTVIKKFDIATPLVVAQKSKLLQVITNLIKNAQEAMNENESYHRTNEIEIIIGQNEKNIAFVCVNDNGCGINKNNLFEIFNHGFTTKKSGHGFGLHTSANSMTEMKGTLTVTSNGEGLGASFTVLLPLANQNKTSAKIAAA